MTVIFWCHAPCKCEQSSDTSEQALS